MSLTPGETFQLLSEIRGEGTEIHEGASPWFKVEDDTFTVISEWYYLAILSLAKIEGNRASDSWISNRLGISRVEAKGALERLQRLQLLRISRGRMYPTKRPLITNHEGPNAARRRYHKQCIEMALNSVDHVAVDRRFITSLTIPASVEVLPEAQEMILSFYKKITKLFECKSANEVFTLAIQLFPVTRSAELQAKENGGNA